MKKSTKRSRAMPGSSGASPWKRWRTVSLIRLLTPSRPFVRTISRPVRGPMPSLDAGGKLHFNRADMNGDHLVILLGRDVPDSHLAELANDGISYIVADGSQIDLPAMLDVLGGELGIRRLLLEGGGGINGSFMAAGFVDEISLLIAPAGDGRAAGRAVFESGEVGLAEKVQLSLTACERLKAGAVHLRYAVSRS
jgi:riboflavin biosynthesis pyrimidine reductase